MATKTEWAVCDRIISPPTQQHKTNLIVYPSFSPNPSLLPSFSFFEKNRK